VSIAGASLRCLAGRLLRRDPYEPRRYWESRARELIATYDDPASWPERRWLRTGVEDETVPRLLQGAGANSVLVVGAGCGREYAYLLRHRFAVRGFDLSPTMVAECRERYPTVETVVDTVIGAEHRHEPADAIVSSAVLAHVPPAEIEPAANSIRCLAGKLIVLREKTLFAESSPYQWQHDYEALFAPWRCVHRETTDEGDTFRAELMAWMPR
jgi:SAM-dependent methyltransferase